MCYQPARLLKHNQLTASLQAVSLSLVKKEWLMEAKKSKEADFQVSFWETAVSLSFCLQNLCSLAYSVMKSVTLNSTLSILFPLFLTQVLMWSCNDGHAHAKNEHICTWFVFMCAVSLITSHVKTLTHVSHYMWNPYFKCDNTECKHGLSYVKQLFTCN